MPVPQTISGSLIINGLFIFQAIVVLVNIKLILQTNTHTWLGLLFQVGSMLWFYIALAAFSYSEFNP